MESVAKCVDDLEGAIHDLRNQTLEKQAEGTGCTSINFECQYVKIEVRLR